jgi:hypothetical protein
MSGGTRAVLLAVAATLLLPAGPAAALDQRPRSARPERGLMPPPPEARYDVLSPWARMNVAPADNEAVASNDDEEAAREREAVPEQGRRTCIRVDRIAGAQLFGDTAIELTMTDGRHWRMFLADECPGLSFYQGFYYRRGKAGMLCAGRDSIGARSGGECAIASIVPMKARDD